MLIRAAESVLDVDEPVERKLIATAVLVPWMNLSQKRRRFSTL